jgi:hypothetical protein
MRLFLRQGVYDGEESRETEAGTPQGGVIRPWTLSGTGWKGRGWFEYFKHAYRSVFEKIDVWVCMRLRSILRKRCRRKGRAREDDHIRRPNAFFTEHGLFSCITACAQGCQSV